MEELNILKAVADSKGILLTKEIGSLNSTVVVQNCCIISPEDIKDASDIVSESDIMSTCGSLSSRNSLTGKSAKWISMQYSRLM